jgi:hypothetical protein
MGMAGKNLFHQRRTRARHADDEHRGIGRRAVSAAGIEKFTREQLDNPRDVVLEPVRIEGLQLKEVTTDGKLQGFSGIYFKTTDGAQAGDLRISDCLIWNASSLAGTSGRAVYGSTFSGAAYLWNNVMVNTGQSELGIRLTDLKTTLHFHNNTVVDYLKHGDQTETKLPRIFKNNLIVGSGMANYRTGYAAGSDYNYSDDTSDTTGTYDIKKGDAGWKAVSFVAASLQDYHLAPADTGATGRGTDLSADPTLPVTTDVDGQLRQGYCDIGADEH